jgi:hypothetical protein
MKLLIINKEEASVQRAEELTEIKLYEYNMFCLCVSQKDSETVDVTFCD